MAGRFEVGDTVRIMTYDEALDEYGADEYGWILLPDGPCEYTNMTEDIGELVATITEIMGDGEFILDAGNPIANSKLARWMIDGSICVRMDESSLAMPSGLLDEYLNAITELIMFT